MKYPVRAFNFRQPLARIMQAVSGRTDEFLYRVGRFELIFPHGHMLATYQTRYRLYDWVLGEIARLVRDKYPSAVAVDIGANVGDTAAVICRHGDIPVLCVEGHPVFAAYLRRNLPRLPACIELAECFVGSTGGWLASETLQTTGGTASIGAERSSGALPVRRFADVLRAHRAFERPRLIKLDTDGCDFDILLSSLDVLRDCRPVVFTEYDPSSCEDGFRLSLNVIEELIGCGYRSFAAYDNYGHFQGLIEKDVIDRFRDLNRYLMSHVRSGRAVHYLDVCAFPASDEDLAGRLQAMHSGLLNDQPQETRLPLWAAVLLDAQLGVEHLSASAQPIAGMW